MVLKQTLQALPILKNKLTKHVLKSAEDSRFKKVIVYRLYNIEKAEKHNMPLKNRLMSPYSKFAITAIK